VQLEPRAEVVDVAHVERRRPGRRRGRAAVTVARKDGRLAPAGDAAHSRLAPTHRRAALPRSVLALVVGLLAEAVVVVVVGQVVVRGRRPRRRLERVRQGHARRDPRGLLRGGAAAVAWLAGIDDRQPGGAAARRAAEFRLATPEVDGRPPRD